MSQRIRGAITTAKYSMQLRRRSFPDNSQEGLFFMPSHSVAKIQSWTPVTDLGCKLDMSPANKFAGKNNKFVLMAFYRSPLMGPSAHRSERVLTSGIVEITRAGGPWMWMARVMPTTKGEFSDSTGRRPV